MIEKLLERFKGAYSYEEGIATLVMATGKINGNGDLVTILKDSHISGVPILLTLKNRKFQTPFLLEKALSITIEYTNQNDETKEAECIIPIYADKDMDFQIIMPTDDEFVKEIIDITLDVTDIGDINDEFQIIGLVGNISRFESVKSIMLSDSLYALKQAQLQKYVETAWDGGLRDLAKDFGINISEDVPQQRFRILTRLFSNFIVPSKPIIEESANIIFGIIPEVDRIDVSGDFDNPYKVIYDIFFNELTFESEFVDPVLVFAERYRPVPAEAVIIIDFEQGLEDSAVINDSGEVEITQDPVHFSSATFFGSGTIFGDATVTILSLPADYP